MALTEVDDLVVRIEHDPDNIVLAAMLVDELVEARGMYRWEAMLHVQRVQQAARDAHDMAWATMLIRSKGPAFTGLIETINTLLGIQGSETMTLFIVAGDHPPEVMIPTAEVSPDMIFHGFPISLPATWVRNWHATTRYQIRPTNPATRAKGMKIRGPRRLPPAEQR